MKRTALYSCLIILFLIFGALSTTAAETPVKVGIIPFHLVSEKPNQQISVKIVELISEKMKSDGADVIILPVQDNLPQMNEKSFQTLGLQHGVDYIVFGSVFVAGQGISIDSGFVDIFNPSNNSTLYTDSDNIENLFPAVKKLTRDIVSQIFKKKIVSDIEIAGNKRVDTDAILRLIDTQTGDILKAASVSRDLKKIYGMGYFDDVTVTRENLDRGIKLIYKVSEKATVRRVLFENNLVYEDEELLEVISSRTGSIQNIHKLNEDIERIRLLYAEKNYHNCTVTYEIKPLENSQSDIVFRVQEEERVKIESITFAGNQAFSADDIKDAMETSERGFFSFFTGSGVLNEMELQNDIIRIESLYKNNGYIDAKVSDPIVTIEKDQITIHFEIEEGFQYRIKTVTIKGDLIVPEQELFELLKSTERELYNRENIRLDINAISDVYANKGFANVQVNPQINKDSQSHSMDITYTITKGDPVYFNRVIITGNNKTRDKVVRREIRVIEQELYNKDAIQRSFKNLERLDFFSNVDIKQTKTDIPNQRNLQIDVVEKETGNFSIGGGFSSNDGAFLMGSVEERNLFGRGHEVKFSAKLASETVLYDISFFEPYLFDTRVSAGFRLYKEDKEYDHYDKEAIGASVNAGYRLIDYLSVGLKYGIEDYEVSSVDTANSNMTPGSFLTSSITPFIKWDSRDRRFLATEGMYHKFSIEYAGEFLGGDIDYTKYMMSNSFYIPIFWKFVGVLHFEGGYLDDRTGNQIDIDFARFYLGGMNSLRGFDRYEIDGKRSGDVKDIGGEKFVQFNAELVFPLVEDYQLYGVLFYDRGDVYRTSDDIDLTDQYSSAGAGIRWNSPVGPIRIEYGWVLEGKDLRDRGDSQVEFSVGASF